MKKSMNKAQDIDPFYDKVNYASVSQYALVSSIQPKYTLSLRQGGCGRETGNESWVWPSWMQPSWIRSVAW